jgi:hypothetical protein
MNEDQSLKTESEPRHETRDFKPVWVGMFVVVLVYVIVVLYMFAFTVFSKFKRDEAGTPQTSQGNAALFPQPRLQIDPQSDLSLTQARDREVLNGYAWTDRTTGAVRIPIERAMDIVAERGLPHFEPPPDGATK